MKRQYIIPIAFFVALLAGHCSSQSTTVAKSLAKFAAQLYQKSAKQNNINIVISPFSIQTATLLLLTGANGKTADEIQSAFYLQNINSSEVPVTYSLLYRRAAQNALLKVANKIVVAKDFNINPSFNAVAKKYFSSEVDPLDFTQSTNAANTINSWVSKQTNDKIKDLFKPTDFSADTKMVLVNAVYFKGEWVNQFEKNNTSKDIPFWNTATEAVKVDTMYTKNDFRYGAFPEMELEVVELPYKDSDLSMLILLPNRRTGLARLENNLTNIDIFEIDNSLFSSELALSLPKFKIETELNLENIFKELGMQTMFSDRADFTIGKTPIKVSKGVHKAFIEIDEKGTKAAAATGFDFVLLSGSWGTKEMSVDHPFMYVIKNSDSILFIGSVKKL